MAIYRNIHVSFWSDPFVLELTPEKKYFFLYLMTNSKTQQSGIYELPKSIIQFETGYNAETVNKLLKEFVNFGKVIYDEHTKEIMLVNWLKYNYSRSPKVISCIQKEIKSIKSKRLKKELNRLSIEFGYSIDTLSQEEQEEKEEQTDKVDHDFEKFWILYDKKVKKQNCLNKWKKIKRIDKEIMFKTLPQYIQSTPDKQYRKDPFTYLNNSSWEDEIINKKSEQEIKTLEFNT